ncbi:MAG: S9 family peptidase [Longimicrobiales bacterium]
MKNQRANARSRRVQYLLKSLVLSGSFLAIPLLPGLGQEAGGDGSSGQEAEEGWTPALSMRYHPVSGTALSPDASLVAFVLREPLMEGEKSEYLSHIWMVATDGGGPRRFTRGEESATSPSFSPDGSYLAFSSGRSGSNQIWVMPVDGGEAKQITDHDTGIGSFEWAPDGGGFAFTAGDPESEEWKTAEKEKRDVILVDRDYRFTHIHSVEFDFEARGSSRAARITEGDFHVTGFDWVPDGSRIVFSHQADPRINTGRLSGDISVVDVESRDIRALVEGAGVESSPLVSPDGRWVAYLSTGGQIEPVGLADVHLVPLEGGAGRRLAETPDRSPGLMAWTGDGRAVLVQEAIRTNRHLLAVPVDGSPPSPVSEGSGVHGSFSFDDDASHFAFTFETPDTPWEVFVSPLDRYRRQALTDLHRGVPRPPMGRTELLEWESPDGRFRIDGLLTYPVGYEEGRRVPLILNVHGGPAGVYSRSFTGGPGIYMLQYFAQQGYAVLRPNPRGSSGYGKEFRYANVRDWGFGDMDDLMAGVDEVIRMEVAHPDSLLLMGWSYGGYMTSFAVTRTDRFQAASMGAGLPNLISMTTTTDIQDYLVAHMDAEFWEDFDVYERHSAMYRIANVTTPTQVIHGAQDLRVPFTQGQEFYRALDRRGVPTEMVVLPRTPHGPREPKLLMAVSEHILRWFETHLGRRPEG